MSENELAIKETSGELVEVQRFTDQEIKKASFSEIKSLDEIDVIETSNISIMPATEESWDCSVEGEFKDVYVMEFKTVTMPSMDKERAAKGETNEVDCAVILEKTPNTPPMKWRVSAKILVSNLMGFVDDGSIVPNTGLTPIRIMYLGERKNSTNNLKSKRFAIFFANRNG